jgi:hypothetical protein
MEKVRESKNFWVASFATLQMMNSNSREAGSREKLRGLRLYLASRGCPTAIAFWVLNNSFLLEVMLRVQPAFY